MHVIETNVLTKYYGKARGIIGMKVRDIIKLSADLHKKDCRKQASQLCEQLQLDTSRKIDELSLGNRKKASIAFLMVICIFLFPEMKGEMDSVSDIFASMGSFSQAFGMNRLNFGEFMRFYGVECGNILGLGGAFFAAFTGILALAKEEKEHTAEFLLFHLAYFIMQIETGSICFSISAFLHRSGLGIGIGLASMLYFLNTIANITEDAKWLKYLTPFGYTEGADIISEYALDWKMIAVGIACAVIFFIIAFLKYNKKDIS